MSDVKCVPFPCNVGWTESPRLTECGRHRVMCFPRIRILPGPLSALGHLSLESGYHVGRRLGPHGEAMLRVPGDSQLVSDRPSDDLRPQPFCLPPEVPISVERDKASPLPVPFLNAWPPSEMINHYYCYKPSSLGTILRSRMKGKTVTGGGGWQRVRMVEGISEQRLNEMGSEQCGYRRKAFKGEQHVQRPGGRSVPVVLAGMAGELWEREDGRE